jgi:hypothetical protein
MTARTGHAERAAGPARGLVQYALVAGPLLSMLDSSIVTVAVEPIARELHAGLTTVQWAVSGYLLALGAGLAGTAYLARRFGTLPHCCDHCGQDSSATPARCSMPGSGSPDRSVSAWWPRCTRLKPAGTAPSPPCMRPAWCWSRSRRPGR